MHQALSDMHNINIFRMICETSRNTNAPLNTLRPGLITIKNDYAHRSV